MFTNCFRAGRLLVCLIALLCVSLLAGRAVKAGETTESAGASNEWIVIPSGIADAETKVAYITAANDGVEAIDLATGHALWENKHIHSPVAVAQGHLIAIEPRGPQEPANSMAVAVVDATTGKIILNSQPIVFPDWIAVDGGIGLGFSSTVAVEGNSLNLRWHAWRQFVGGVPPSAEAVSAAKKDETGIARVDLETGHTEVKMEPLAKAPRQPSTGRYTDVGNIRLMVTEHSEKVPGGVQLIRRTLEASDKGTGRPLWHHEIASDFIVPANLPQQAQAQNQGEIRR